MRGVTECWGVNMVSVRCYYPLQIRRQLIESVLGFFRWTRVGSAQQLMMCLLITFTLWVTGVSRDQVSNHYVCALSFRTLTHMWEQVKSCMKQLLSLLSASSCWQEFVLPCAWQDWMSVEQQLLNCCGFKSCAEPSLALEAWYWCILKLKHSISPLYLL